MPWWPGMPLGAAIPLGWEGTAEEGLPLEGVVAVVGLAAEAATLTLSLSADSLLDTLWPTLFTRLLDVLGFDTGPLL